MWCKVQIKGYYLFFKKYYVKTYHLVGSLDVFKFEDPENSWLNQPIIPYSIEIGKKCVGHTVQTIIGEKKKICFI